MRIVFEILLIVSSFAAGYMICCALSQEALRRAENILEKADEDLTEAEKFYEEARRIIEANEARIKAFSAEGGKIQKLDYIRGGDAEP